MALSDSYIGRQFDSKQWIVGLAMQVFNDSKGELRFTVSFAFLLRACLRGGSGERIVEGYLILDKSLVIYCWCIF